MNKNFVLQLAVFVVLLLALNQFFHLHISMIGSLLLTTELTLVMPDDPIKFLVEGIATGCLPKLRQLPGAVRSVS
jgi:hypothetical protein